MSAGDRDTIFALSSGSPPAAIAIVRISGPEADAALQQLGARLPDPRHAALARLGDPATGEVLDNAVIIRFPGPSSATGEDIAELHLHGGRAVVMSVMAALGGIEGLRAAEPGEFTRRAFENGRIDLAEAEGLADLLAAETQSQRRAALVMAGGSVGRLVAGWEKRLLDLAAQVEAALDFSDEGEVGEAMPADWGEALSSLSGEIAAMLEQPTVERLREGVRVVIAGPPNAGKSSLLNVLAGRDAAITSELAGTTRDLVEAPTAIGGMPFLLVDTAGLRDSASEVEAIGIGRAKESLDTADLILWLGEAAACPDRARSIIVAPKSDLGKLADLSADISVSAQTGEGIAALVELLKARAATLLPLEGEVALNDRHRGLLQGALGALAAATDESDFLLVAEHLRSARIHLDRITGKAGTEDMLDALFGRFCVGK